MSSANAILKNLRSMNYILVAEDDLDDQELIQDALSDNDVIADKIKFVEDGEQLLSALNNAVVLPNIILLDLNMPKKSGREALSEIKANQKFNHIPIVIFTTSDSEIDIKECYSMGSNAYLTKPNSYTELVDLMKGLIAFWFGQACIVYS